MQLLNASSTRAKSDERLCPWLLHPPPIRTWYTVQLPLIGGVCVCVHAWAYANWWCSGMTIRGCDLWHQGMYAVCACACTYSTWLCSWCAWHNRAMTIWSILSIRVVAAIHLSCFAANAVPKFYSHIHVCMKHLACKLDWPCMDFCTQISVCAIKLLANTK